MLFLYYGFVLPDDCLLFMVCFRPFFSFIHVFVGEHSIFISLASSSLPSLSSSFESQRLVLNIMRKPIACWGTKWCPWQLWWYDL